MRPNLEKPISSNDLYSDDFIFWPTINIWPTFKPPLRIAILASGNGSNFQAIYESIITSKLNAEIAILIVNNKDCGAHKKALEYNIRVQVLDHRDYSTRHFYDEHIVNTCQSLGVEGIIMAGWMRIVTTRLINEFPQRIINIHPSLLPSFRGINAPKQAIESGVKIAGCSTHYVVKEIDSGEIISQAALRVRDNYNSNDLHSQIKQLEHRILPISIAIAGKKWRELN